MNKLFALLLVAAALTVSVGCGGSTESTSPSTPPAAETPADGTAPAETPAEGTGP